MLSKKNLLRGVMAITIVLVALLFMRSVNSQVLDNIEIIEETDSYVELRAGNKTGRFVKSFSYKFDDPNFLNWFGPESWAQMTLLSPMMPTDGDYTVLSRDILKGEADFVDNSVGAYHGAARFEAMAPADGLVTSKSDIQMMRMWFTDGDDLWFRGRFFFESGVPYSLVDFEDNNVRGSPGPRIVIDGQRFVGVELKAWSKPRLRQRDVEVPLGQWFELVLHMKLGVQDGHVMLWQDGQLILDGNMQTLPSEGSLLNSFEIGITATDMAAVMLLDDVAIGHQPF